MGYKRSLVLYLYLFFLLWVCSFAEPGGVPGQVKSFTALADARRMIVHNGCVWIGGGGLTRYHISRNEVNHYVTGHGLVANAVFDVAVDVKNNALWAATSSGLGRLDLETQRWKSFTAAEGLLDPFVLSLDLYDRQGETLLFIGTRIGGLYFLPEHGDIIIPAVDQEILPDSWVSCTASDPCRNSLWLGTAAGVVRLQFKNGNWPLEIDPLLEDNDIPARRLVVNEQNGDLFCLNYYNEIFHYRLSGKKWEKVPPPPGKDIKITDLVLDSVANILWAASDRGIYEYRIKPKQWTPVPGYREAVSCITFDPQSSSLYYTSHEGLHSFPRTKKLIKGKEGESCLLLPNTPPFNNTVSAICIDEKTDTTWVGTDWGIAKLDNRTSQWQFFPLSSYPGERVMAVSVDDKHVWFGTVHHGLCKMDRKTRVMNEIRGTPRDAMVTSIIEDEKVKKIWFGLLGAQGGVYEYNLEKGAMRVLPYLDSQSVTYLLEDGDWIWVGTGRGVGVFNKWEGPRANLFDPGLAFGQVLTLALDSQRNHLWITTEFEVIVYDRAKKRHEIFKRPDGFPWSPITAILFDGEKIWLGSEGYGLYVYSPMEGVKNSLTRVEGTADSYIITLTHDKRKGVVWVGTVFGGISVGETENRGRR